MDRMALFVVTKKGVFFSKEHDHYKKLTKPFLNVDHILCRLCPKDENYSIPTDEWLFSVDPVLGKSDVSEEEQALFLVNYLPNSLFSLKSVEIACREKLKEWAKYHILPNGGTCQKNQTRIVLSGGVKITGGKCWIYGETKSNIQDAGEAHLYDCARSIKQASGVVYLQDKANSDWQNGGVVIGNGKALSSRQEGGRVYLFDKCESRYQYDGISYLFDFCKSVDQYGGLCVLSGDSRAIGSLRGLRQTKDRVIVVKS